MTPRDELISGYLGTLGPEMTADMLRQLRDIAERLDVETFCGAFQQRFQFSRTTAENVRRFILSDMHDEAIARLEAPGN